MNKYLLKVFLEHFGFGLTIPFSVIWLLERGLSITQVGIIQSFVFVATFLLEIPTGVVADKFGRKTSLVLGSALHTLGLALLLFAHSFWLFALSSIITGAAWAFISGAEEAYIHDTLLVSVKKTYKQFFARVTLIDEISTLLGMIIGSGIILISNLQAVFGLATTSMFLTLIVILSILPNDKKENKSNIPTIVESPKELKTLLNQYSRLLPLFLIFGVLFESARLLWQPHLVSMGISVAELGFIFAALKLFSIAGSYVAEHVEIPNISGIIIASSIGAVCLLVFSMNNAWIAAASLAIYFFVENIIRVGQSAYLVEHAPSAKDKATFLSGNSLIRNLFSAGISPILAFISVQSLVASMLGLFILKGLSIAFFIKKNNIRNTEYNT